MPKIVEVARVLSQCEEDLDTWVQQPSRTTSDLHEFQSRRGFSRPRSGQASEYTSSASGQSPLSDAPPLLAYPTPAIIGTVLEAK